MEFTIYGYENTLNGEEHIALVMGQVDDGVNQCYAEFTMNV